MGETGFSHKHIIHCALSLQHNIICAWRYLYVTKLLNGFSCIFSWTVSPQMTWTFCRSFLFRCPTAATPPWLWMTEGVQSYRWDSTPPWLSLFNSSSLTGMDSFPSPYVNSLLIARYYFTYVKVKAVGSLGIFFSSYSQLYIFIVSNMFVPTSAYSVPTVCFE